MFNELQELLDQFQAKVYELEREYRDLLNMLGDMDEDNRIVAAKDMVKFLARIEDYKKDVLALNSKAVSDEIPF